MATLKDVAIEPVCRCDCFHMLGNQAEDDHIRQQVLPAAGNFAPQDYADRYC
jgi:hypothetical protein